MAKFGGRSGWLVPVGKPYRTPDGLTMQDFRVRWWHPGLWWELLKMVRISRGPWLGGKG